jgi:predicted nucleic acid-binding protein
LDTSAILASVNGEPGFERVQTILHEAEGDSVRVLIPFMAMMEVEYQFRRDLEEGEVEYWLGVIMSWPAELIESYPNWRTRAAAVKVPGKLSVADAWVASLALVEDGNLIHKDPEFDAVFDLKHLRLPYDRDQRTRP